MCYNTISAKIMRFGCGTLEKSIKTQKSKHALRGFIFLALDHNHVKCRIVGTFFKQLITSASKHWTLKVREQWLYDCVSLQILYRIIKYTLVLRHS